MVELFALWTVCRNIGRIARSRGVYARPFQARAVALWFVFEFAAIALGLLVGLSGALLYIVAVIGAFASLPISFNVVRSARRAG